MANLLPDGKQQFFDGNGAPLANGTVAFYVPNTTTPKDTWQDSAETVLNPNPVPLDANGAAVIYGDGDYRQIVFDANGNVIWDRYTASPVQNGLGTATDVAPSQNAVSTALSERPLTSDLLSLGNPIPINTATVLDSSAINATVIISAAFNFLVNLPAASIDGVAVKLIVKRSSVGLVTIQAAPSSGYLIDGSAKIYMIGGESLTLVFRADTGWIIIDQVFVPVCAELINTTTQTLTSSFADVPLTPGTQLMNVDLHTVWMNGNYFCSPRDAVYDFDLHFWLSLTGSPGQIDLGYYAATSPSSSSPGSSSFDRLSVTGDTFVKVIYSSRVRLSAGACLIPSIRFNAPITAGSIVDAGTLTSSLRVTEVRV